MASIFSKRGFLWLGWYEVDHNGKKIHPQIKLNLKDTKQNRKAAELFRQQKEIELRTSKHRYIGRVLTSEAVLRFMNTKRYKSKNTVLIYNYSIAKIKNLDVKYLRDFSKNDIELLIEKFKSENKSNETIKTYLRHIKIFFEYCVGENLIENNPVESYKTKSNNVVKIITGRKIYNRRREENFE